MSRVLTPAKADHEPNDNTLAGMRSPTIRGLRRLRKNSGEALKMTAEEVLVQRAQNTLRICTGQAGLITFYQQLALALPITMSILTRLACFVGKHIPEMENPGRPLLAGALTRIAEHLQAKNLDVRMTSRDTFIEFGLATLTEAERVTGYSVVALAPPNANRATPAYIWRWWERDFLVWYQSVSFGVTVQPIAIVQAPEPPYDARRPRPIPDEVIAAIAEIAIARNLESLKAQLLLPRLFYDEDILLLAEFMQPPGATELDSIF